MKSMNYIVLDLEWNQSLGKNDYELPFEIVEIGAVKLNRHFKIVDRFEQIIKPQIYHTIHFMTSKIVQLDKEELDAGRPFPEVMQEFLDWCGRKYVFCIWGTLDLTELQKNMCYYGMDELSAGPLKYFDIQKFFSLTYEDGKARRALEYAVDYLQIEKDIPFHRAYSDAYYTAEIFRRLKKRELEVYESFDVYSLPQSPEKEIHVTFPTYSKYISRGFPERRDVLRDKEARSLRCFCCDAKTSVFIPWVSVNGKQYFAMGKCPEHGKMRGHLRIRKHSEGVVYGMKTIRPAKPGDEGDLRQKEKTAKEQERKYLNMLRNSQKSKSSNSEK